MSSTQRDISRLITRCEQYEREVGELKKEIDRLKTQVEQYRPIAKGDTVEIYQSLGPKTEPDDVGFVSEVRWVHGDTVCLDIGTLASICDVRRTTQAVTETADRIKVGDEVEVFQATISPWTVPSEVGIRGVVTGIMSEIGWLRDSENCIDVDVVEIGEDNVFALCDVRKVC